MPRARDAEAGQLTHLALAVAILIWSGNYVVVKLTLSGWIPMAFNACRCVLAAVLMLGAIRLTVADGRLPGRQLGSLAVLGLGWNAAYQALFVLAIERTAASNVALVFATAPVWVGLWGQFRGTDRLGGLQWIGVLTSIVGVALVVSRARIHFGGGSFVGDGLALLGTIAFSGYTIHVRQIPGPGPMWAAGWGMAFTAVLVTALAVPSLIEQARTMPPAPSWLGVFYSGALSLALSYWLFTWAVRAIGSVRASVPLNLIPLATALFARLVLGETWTPTQWVGATVTVLGVYLARRQGRAAPA